MKRISVFLTASAIVLCGTAFAADSPTRPTVKGHYLEARSCDVYTGPCFANGEVGQAGREAILTWSVREGAWNGVALDGLTVIAVVKAAYTLGDPYHNPYPAQSLLILDARAGEKQKEALTNLAKTMGGKLLEHVVDTKTAAIQCNLGTCEKKGCGQIEAEGLVKVSTRCLGGDDHVCGNETAFYPPLTPVEDALPAYTQTSVYRGEALGLTWDESGRRSAFLGTFAR